MHHFNFCSQALQQAASQTFAEILSRLSLHPGSPKALFFINSEMQVTDLSRQAYVELEVCLQTHHEMYSVLDFIPEWYLFSQWEEIPGLQTFHGG